MLSSHLLGRRLSVRRRLPDGKLTDVVGHLLDLTPAEARLLRKDGSVAGLDPRTVTAVVVAPDRVPVRRAWAVPDLSPAGLQAVCSAGWPARESEPLGDWLLRAHEGITGRANSVMAVGDPGTDLPSALSAVQSWYGARGLPPLLQLPLADPANEAMEQLGWARQHVTVVQVAPVPALLGSLAERDDLAATVTPEPDDDWCALMHDLDDRDPAAHLAILTGPPVVGFATLRRGGEPVGIGRVSVEGTWAGITSVDVAPAARRQGIGTAVMRTLLVWADGAGARTAYLQVRAANDAALRLYAGLGFVTHHPYCYRAPRVAG